jgi:hypothetical protein
MTKPPIRRLTLADLAIFIAGAAGAFVLLRKLHKDESNRMLGYHEFIRLHIIAILLSAAVTLMVARLISPRPRLRRMMRQPGTAACIAFLFSFAIEVASFYGKILLDFILSRPSARFSPFVSDLVNLMGGAMQCGLGVALVWATQAVTGVWRTEPSWIDRSGRVLGLLSILLAISQRLDY